MSLFVACLSVGLFVLFSVWFVLLDGVLICMVVGL